MARSFRRQHTTHPISELNVTNLIDVAFTLLIIFMIATPLIQEEQTIQVNLPTESKRPQDKPDKDLTFQSIAIDKRGVYYFGNNAHRVRRAAATAGQELAGRPEATRHSHPRRLCVTVAASRSLDGRDQEA